MKKSEIHVTYQWIAKPGKAEELKNIYKEVEQQMKDTEPGALAMMCYFEESSNTLVVYDMFKDGAALGQHLGTTAAGHFPGLLEVAVPGQFIFLGDVPAELQQAALGMGLNAIFAPYISGFRR